MKTSLNQGKRQSVNEGNISYEIHYFSPVRGTPQKENGQFETAYLRKTLGRERQERNSKGDGREAWSLGRWKEYKYLQTQIKYFFFDMGIDILDVALKAADFTLFMHAKDDQEHRYNLAFPICANDIMCL